MRSIGILLLATGLLLVVSGCSGILFHSTPTSVDFDDVCEHEHVTISGRLQVGSLQTTTDDYYLSLMEAAQPGGEGRILLAAIRVGYSPNRIEPLPSMFNDLDVKIHTDENQIIGNGQTVILTGSVMADERGFAGHVPCRLYEVDKIELP